MNTIRVNLSDPKAALQIGRRGENEVAEVIFDYSAWVAEFGPGVVSLLVRRSKDNSAYPVAMTSGAGNTVIWAITSTDTQYVGGGRAELNYTIDEQIAKSVVYKTNVLPDIGEPSETPPDPYETWLETLTALGAEVEGYAQDASNSADAAEAAVAHYPYIGADNYWYVWNAETEQFVNTGVKAEGVDGTNGTDGKTIWTASAPPTQSGSNYRFAMSSLLPSGGRAKSRDIVIETSECKVWVVNTATSTFVNVSLLCNFKGDPGYSPTVTVEEISGGHRVTITDADGDHVFDVMDGTGGGGTSDYDQLSNRPQINSHTLTGNQSAADLGLGTYSKPSGGIPKTDLASAVQTSLGKADTALQSAPVTSVNGQTGAVTVSVPSASSATPQALGTAAAGTSADFSRADHVHAKPTASDIGAVAVAQGVGHSGEFLVVGSDGNVTTVTMSVWQGGNF